MLQVAVGVVPQAPLERVMPREELQPSPIRPRHLTRGDVRRPEQASVVANVRRQRGTKLGLPFVHDLQVIVDEIRRGDVERRHEVVRRRRMPCVWIAQDGGALRGPLPIARLLGTGAERRRERDDEADQREGGAWWDEAAEAHERDRFVAIRPTSIGEDRT